MSTPQGPTFRELAVQALSSVEHGYDLLAPKFDATAFRTGERVLAAVADALRELGPFATGLDHCCGTGAGVGVLREVCTDRVVGVDFSAGMLARARRAFPAGAEGPAVRWVRADVRRLPFAPAFDVVTGFGAFGHFLPREFPALFAEVRSVLRHGGVFAFPVVAPPRVGSRAYWTLWGFDAAMRLRNTVWWPRFVMYYRTFRLADVTRDLAVAGFDVSTTALEALGRRADGSPRCRLVVARRR
ncbi:Ubiquinone/menaquinone biosynthesis C-methyltransferase UbiE [Streptomyces sp. RB5]|uniref:Ubiquinone/menaquinone biosynthesis C-methyltransferase UbiE n=1 Tax=Streptomyces smaragdinus TaxID=2585196 RepID=A0A7K0CAJ8_9ACTN|nr:class I SAM-dependent methyltransferase [Streptomyces smaragdinus]MQY10426.1 Ubiquinone/menaquinone biosynthesis C-methyltransferase UbiE [Streptomyces smaragdinus]